MDIIAEKEIVLNDGNIINCLIIHQNKNYKISLGGRFAQDTIDQVKAERLFGDIRDEISISDIRDMSFLEI